MNTEIRYPRNGGTCIDTVRSVRQLGDYVQIQTTWYDGCVPNAENKEVVDAVLDQASHFHKQASELLDKAARLEAIAQALNQ